MLYRRLPRVLVHVAAQASLDKLRSPWQPFRPVRSSQNELYNNGAQSFERDASLVFYGIENTYLTNKNTGAESNNGHEEDHPHGEWSEQKTSRSGSECIVVNKMFRQQNVQNDTATTQWHGDTKAHTDEEDAGEPPCVSGGGFPPVIVVV